MSAPPGNYAGRYGSEAPTFADFIARLKVAALPSRAGLPSAQRLTNDPAWQAWLAFPIILWLVLVVCGAIAAFARRAGKSAAWPLAIGVLWATIGALAYMPWPGLATFYMLPFAFGVAFVTAHAFNSLNRFRLIRIVAALAMIELITVSAVEARDIVHEHELRVMTDADLISTIAHDGRHEPLFAAVPDPAPVGSYGWAKKLAEYANSKQPIPWVRVYIVLPGVAWNHRVHLEAGVKCETCHGQVREMDAVSEVTSVTTMYGCLNCHEMNHAKVACDTCHKR
jgi:hypothetical protein